MLVEGRRPDHALRQQLPEDWDRVSVRRVPVAGGSGDVTWCAAGAACRSGDPRPRERRETAARPVAIEVCVTPPYVDGASLGHVGRLQVTRRSRAAGRGNARRPPRTEIGLNYATGDRSGHGPRAGRSGAEKPGGCGPARAGRGGQAMRPLDGRCGRRTLSVRSRAAWVRWRARRTTTDANGDADPIRRRGLRTPRAGGALR